jgi:DNA-binding response OmpR family regulator
MKTPKKILIVEDDETSRTALTAMLEALGHQVVAFGDPRKVVEGLNGQHIDLGLLDIMMPHMNGYQVLEKLREVPAYQSIPIFMVTARDTEDDVLTGYKHGADYYLTKPFTSKQLRYGLDLYLSDADDDSKQP